METTLYIKATFEHPIPLDIQAVQQLTEVMMKLAFNAELKITKLIISDINHRYSKCPRCGYYAFNGSECFDCGYPN